MEGVVTRDGELPIKKAEMSKRESLAKVWGEEVKT